MRLAALALLLCGCVGFRQFMEDAGDALDRERWRAAAERERYVAKAPGLPSSFGYAIIRGEVLPGMTEADVEAALGPAADTERKGRTAQSGIESPPAGHRKYT